ncbi:MAG: right-handed parallel beta-helix repeat-containing protein, partial [Pseudohongiellaceae bacterium]
AAQSVLLSGETRAQIRGSTFNLNDTAVAGRAAVHATVGDPTAAATTFGSLIVEDCTFDRMGRAADPAIYLEAGFGMTVSKNRFFNTLAAAVGWRGDARRVDVSENLIDTITSGLAAIYVRAGLNTQIGTAWNIRRNTILDVAVGDGILIEGANSSAAEFARNIRIADNLINTVASEYINVHQVQDALLRNNQCADGAVDGIVLRSIAGVITLDGNSVQNHTGEGISANEASLQTALLVLKSNVVNGVASADGVTVNNLSSLVMVDNDLVNLVNGLTLGTIGTRAKVRGNNFNTVTTPLVLSGTQTGLDFGDNAVANLAALQALTVAAEAVDVSGPYHTITAGSATNLTDIGGVHTQGKVLVLLLATGSSDITLIDGADLILNGNFLMDDPGTDNIWLVSDGADWVELDRRSTA